MQVVTLVCGSALKSDMYMYIREGWGVVLIVLV